MNEPRIGVKVKHDRSIDRKQGIKVPVRQAVRVLGFRYQFEQVHDVDEANFELGEGLLQQDAGGQGFLGGDVAAAGQHHVGFFALVGAGPVPDAKSLGAVLDGRLPVQVLQV